MTVPVLVIHGGAGRIPDAEIPGRAKDLARSLAAGWDVLARGGSALDAVVAAVRVMEDSPLFNAGYGATLTRAGTVEMDAGLMDGASLNVGAVAAVRRVANPLLLARHVLEHSPHILLVGEGAEAFAQAQGLPLVDPDALIAPGRQEALRRWLAEHAQADGGDTVGAVALDISGHLAAATSTGGILGKMPGRVGDSPLVGCGFYADDALGACSTTGVGESIARALLAYRAVHGLRVDPPQAAAEAALAYMAERIGGRAGLILLSRTGEVAAVWNTARMSYAVRTPEGEHIHPG